LSLIAIVLLLAALVFAGCGGGAEDAGEEPEEAGDAAAEETTEEAAAGGEDTLTIYSGRNEELIGPILEQFEEESGITTEVRYGDTAELAATILEEGENSPADVFFAQDAGALGAIQQEGLFQELPGELLERVDNRFSSREGEWIGISGRARVVAYNTDNVTEDELPESIMDFTDPKWEGRIGWAPTNGSFQAFVTALRVTEGEDAAREWLEGIQANEPRVYENNTSTLEGVIAGEVDVGFINHYYLYRAIEEQGEVPAENYYPTGGDPGALVNVAGVGILNTSDSPEEARQLLEFLLSDEAQEYFAQETYEYPLVSGIPTDPAVIPIEEIDPPDIDLSDLEDLEGTLQLLEETGAL
jgi:iron(III) transport system substrate-binding protein